MWGRAPPSLACRHSFCSLTSRAVWWSQSNSRFSGTWRRPNGMFVWWDRDRPQWLGSWAGLLCEWVRASRTAQDAAEDEFSVSGALMLLFGAQTGRLWSQELPFFCCICLVCSVLTFQKYKKKVLTFIEIDEHSSRHRSLIYCTFMIYKTF